MRQAAEAPVLPTAGIVNEYCRRGLLPHNRLQFCALTPAEIEIGNREGKGAWASSAKRGAGPGGVR